MAAVNISTAKTGSMPSLVKKAPSRAKIATEKPIEYEDKSAGQPALLPIFNQLKALLEQYNKDSLKAQQGTSGMYNLVSKKPVELFGKMRELFFASIMVQKGHVGFYFFPIYTDPVIAKELQPELLNCLKGKSCFHIKKDDKLFLNQVEHALQLGYKLYQEKGYL